MLLRATRGARNPNLQVVVTHASHVQMYVASIRLDFHEECMECTERNLIKSV